MLLFEIIPQGAENHPDRPAIIFRDKTLTYGELSRQVCRLASALPARGVAPGHSVAVLLPNCPETTIG